MSYEIAIPSHKRAESIGSKTLLYLAESGIDRERIRVFVAPDQASDYEAQLDSGLYAEIIPSALGVTANHNFITSYYDENQELVRADDDLRYLGRKVDDKVLSPINNLHSWIQGAFDLSAKTGSSLWGIYPVANPYFMKPKLSTGLTFIIGQFFGALNKRDEILKAPVKQDYERSIKRFLDSGTVLRFDDVCGVSAGITSYGGGIRSQKGGLQSWDRAALNQEAVEYLLATYPDFVVEKKKSKTNYREIKLSHASR